jgi:SAM-dependent methyltransferase
MPLVCPDCRVPLEDMRCPSCGTQWPVSYGIADFSRGAYYDRYSPDDASLARDREGWAMEMDGSRRRIADFYEPLLRREGARRVLDSGCGNGLSVDLLNERGYDAWGNDLSQLRQFQWRERQARERLVVASSLRLPFPDAYFDAVISSGVIEHIGVVESALPHYAVAPLADRDAQRAAFLAELVRVTRAGGVVFVDCPNGAFPIDFWHGDRPGAPRRHSRGEGFLPTFAEIRALAPPAMRVDALSPYKRLQFHQARRHWYGRLLGPLGNAWFAFMRVVPWLARTALNPFLVVRIHPARSEGST